MFNVKTLLLCAALASYSFADMYIDLSKNQLKCGSYTISQSSTTDDLMKNCKVVDTDTDVEFNGVEKKIKFIPEGGGMMTKCKFLNGKLQMCYYDD